MKTFVYSALVAAVLAQEELEAGARCYIQGGSCGAVSCCGTGILIADGTESKNICSGAENVNPDEETYESFNCDVSEEEGARALGVSAASVIAASYYLF